MAANAAIPRTRTGPVQGADSNHLRPRTVHIHVQATPTGAAANSPHPRTRISLNRSQTGIRPERTLSADSPQSRTVHVHNLVTDRNCPRTSTGRELSASQHRRIRFTAHQFPGSHPNHSSLCPHLIQPQFARRSKNLRPAVHRSSRICSRRRMSSRNCDRGARRIAPSLTCSRNIVCQSARRPSPCSVIKCSAKPFGHAGGQDESVRLFPRRRMVLKRPRTQCQPARPAQQQNRPLTPMATKRRQTRTRGPRIAQVRMLKPQST